MSNLSEVKIDLNVNSTTLLETEKRRISSEEECELQVKLACCVEKSRLITQRLNRSGLVSLARWAI